MKINAYMKQRRWVRTLIDVAGILILLISTFTTPSMAAGELTGNRNIPDQEVKPGETFDVSVELTLNEALSSFNLKETLPEGWILTSKNDDANSRRTTGSSTEWVWLMTSFEAGTVKIVEYSVFVPEDAEEGSYHITGNTLIEVNGAGVTTDTGGDSEVRVKKAISESPLTSNRNIPDQEVKPGDTFNVSVELTLNEALSSFNLKETLPEGWILTSKNDDANSRRTTGSSTEWVWLMTSFEAGTVKIVEYSVFIPEDAEEGSYHITGNTLIEVNGAGVTTDTGGDSEVRVKDEMILKADFCSNKTGGSAPLTVKFTSLSTGGPFNWEWNFGDGDVSTEENPLHVYSSSGDYTVSLTVSNAGESDCETKENYICVQSETNWISWIDPRSDGGKRITTAELQEIIYYWLNDLDSGPLPEE